MQIHVLGPVRVVGPNGQASLQGARQRAVLGVLALHAGTAVSRERLVDVLWDENPPRTAVRSLHSHVARVRQALTGCGVPDVLRTSGPGYVLTIEPDVVDANRFEQCVRSVQHAAPEDAVRQLRDGLALWQGDALADAGLRGWGTAEVDRLHELRLSAWESLWDAEIRLGRHRAAVSGLERLLVSHPIRERLVRLYMLALYRCDRQTDALAAYQRLRDRLADELGIDPGAELSELYTSILNQDQALAPQRVQAHPAPAQLPARAGYFTGRGSETQALTAMLDAAPQIMVISGPGGMGKTSLAVEWAHDNTARFPNGQLFLDVRGHDPDTAMSASEALTHLLLGLGVPDDRMPTELIEKAALYRSLLHGKRVLILLDNCGEAEDVLPLVPGSATSLLLITSRNTLAALAVRYAVRAVSLDALSHSDAMALLAQVLGDKRIARESVPAARLARLCGGMPLALRIAAAKLLTHPERPIRELAGELASPNRLDSLAVAGDSRTVRAVFDSAYRMLSPSAARAFRILGRFPGQSFGEYAAAAMCGVPVAQARPWIAELAASHLIIATTGDRYRFHDLIGVFARECPSEEEPAARLLDWYLALAEAANQVLDSTRDRIRPAVRHAADLPKLATRPAVLAFLDAERPNLVAVVRYANQQGQYTAAWQLTAALTSFFDARGYWAERITMCRLGVVAARELGDPAVEGEMLRSLGTAYRLTRRMTEALDCYPRALALVREAGDVRGEAAVHNNIGGSNVELRRFGPAVEAYLRSIELHTIVGNRWGLTVALRNLGFTYVRMGQSERSVEPLHRALALAQEIDNARMEAAVRDSLGEAFLHLGEIDTALAQFRAALAIGRRIGDRRFEAETLNNIGIALLGQGDPDAALSSHCQALAVSRDLADRHTESLSLTNIGHARLATGDFGGAHDDYQAALAIRKGIPDSYEEAQLYRALAELADRRGDAGTARQHHELAITLYRKANADAEADALMATTRE